MKSIFSNLTFQVLVAISLGVLVGVLYPTDAQKHIEGFAPYAQQISKAFVSMISMLIGAHHIFYHCFRHCPYGRYEESRTCRRQSITIF
jgi:Na+/H+-dicarboxylate symporter